MLGGQSKKRKLKYIFNKMIRKKIKEVFPPKSNLNTNTNLGDQKRCNI